MSQLSDYHPPEKWWEKIWNKIPWDVVCITLAVITVVISVGCWTQSWSRKQEQTPVVEPVTYQVTIRCYNCFRILHLDIPFGLTYEQWLDRKGKCPNCRHVLDKNSPLCQKQHGFFDNYKCGDNK